MISIVHLSDTHLSLDDPVLRLWEAIPQPLRSLAGKIPFYTRANPDCLRVLPSDLASHLHTLDGPAVVVVSGDIATYPCNRNSLDEFFKYLTSESNRLIPGDFVGLNIPYEFLFTILGNHDVLRRDSNAEYRSSNFGTVLRTPWSRTEFRRVAGTLVVAFHINSMVGIFPPWGTIGTRQIQWLAKSFAALEGGAPTLPSGRSNPIPKSEYAKAIRLLILHHSPLERVAYSNFDSYFFFQLFRRELLEGTCTGHVDAVLFGHTHRPIVDVWQGMIAVDNGTVAAEHIGEKLGDNHFTFHVLSFAKDRSCHVDAFHYSNGSFTRTPAADFRASPQGYVRI